MSILKGAAVIAALWMALALSHCAEARPIPLRQETVAASGPAPVRSWRSGEYGGVRVITFTDQWGRHCTALWDRGQAGGVGLHCNDREEF